ncbi:MAG: MCE family protein [Thermoleophilia bacterium]|nr:MCE family protein [Thermoleophilia bacterium]
MRKVILIVIAILVVIAAFLLLRSCGDDAGAYKVRAVFDNGAFVVPGEDVRVAGANVGSVDSIDVSMPDEVVSSDPEDEVQPGKAIIVLNITDKGFQDFRDNASCLIRPQSLIGEKFIDCSVTEPRPSGTEAPPELTEIPDGDPGAGQHLLPLENNGKSVDQDLITNIYRLPYAQRFRIILNELGAGLATRGPELRETITRANPALMQVNKVLKILASQNKRLAELARNGDKNLTQLAAKRKNLVGFFRSAGSAAGATAERGDDLEGNLRELPQTLRELRATFNALGTFSTAAKPVFDSLRPNVKQISEVTTKLKPFAEATEISLDSLGRATRTAGPDLIASRPIIQKLGKQARTGKQPATDLNFLLSSTRQNGGFKNFMKFIYGSGSSLNGYDQYGHYQRTNVVVTPCTEYQTQTVIPVCNASWTDERDRPPEEALDALPDISALGDSLEDTTGASGDTGATDGAGTTGPSGLTGDTDTTDAFEGADALPGALSDPDAGTTGDTGDTNDPRGNKYQRKQRAMNSRMAILDYLLSR